MYKFLLIFTIVLVSGFIAFIGDNVGRKIGKKRISLLKLRPKYTAIIITIFTGITISVISITILSLVSQDARTALFGLEKLKKELNILSEELNSKTQELEEARLKLGNLKREILKKEQELEASNQKLKELERTKKDIENELSEAFTLIKTLRDEEKNLKDMISSLTAQKNKLKSEINELNRTVKILRRGIDMVRQGKVIYYSGQQIAQTIVEGGQTREKVEQQLFNFIAYASELAIKKGAKPDPKIGKVFFISKTQFSKIVDKIVASPGKNFVVRLVAPFNVLKGEPIPVQIYAQENRLIFKKGEVIVEDIFSPSESPQDIEAKIFILLRRANAEAVEKGIVPDPERGTVGIISVYNIYQAINKIKSSKQEVKVKVITTKDIWTADKVRAEIVVEPIKKNT